MWSPLEPEAEVIVGQAAAEDPEPQGVVTKAQGFRGTGQGPHVFKELPVPQCLPPLITPERAAGGVEPRAAGLSESRDPGPCPAGLAPERGTTRTPWRQKARQFPCEPWADTLGLS